ncbi:hypothetical protein F4860DRAFT_507949 [Xylaria cubensis]|nr:hypothetical protein F4860DRAFT_507949 [Xylaria cubensis]
MKEFEKRFPDEPQGRIEKGSSIRSKVSWQEVLEVLGNAASAYSTKTGIKGAFKRLSRLVPDVNYTKPIVGTLVFLLQAFKQTSRIREEVNDGIERFEKNFDRVEAYIEMYSSKLRVVDAAMTLYVTILKAIEEVIGYYTKHMVIKGMKAVWNGERYEESLLSCLENITEVSKELMNEADTAHKQVTNKLAGDMEAAQLARSEQLLRRATTPEPPTPTKCIVNQEDLLQFLDSTGLETTDINYITNQRELIISRGQDRTEQIMNSSQLRQWLVQADSKELLIHGNSESVRVSPISFFCAILMQNLRSVEKFKSVAFFCGCHPYDDFGGARTLIISLLSQILQQQPFDLSFIDHEIAYRMDSGDTQAFCYVFGRLVEQVERTETVFCVIDGINFYECNGEEQLQEMAYVLRFLLDLAENRGSTYKILVTSPSSTEDVRQAIRDEDYLSLPEQAANTLGFSKERFGRQWQEGFEATQGQAVFE